ncbi:hypothetical protein KUTeg_021180, partial [Tegillarca granosa]
TKKKKPQKADTSDICAKGPSSRRKIEKVTRSYRLISHLKKSMLRNCMKLNFVKLYSRNFNQLHTVTMNSATDTCRKDINIIFQSAVKSVEPKKLIERTISVKQTDGNCTLTVGDMCYDINRNVYVVGFGKAVSGMARAIDDCLNDHIVKGIISIPNGTHQTLTQAGKQNLLVDSSSKIKAYEGGGSALQPLPCPPITLEDELEITKTLSRNGASITELNVVRKNIEILKGGGLVQAAYPAKVLTLIMSDVIDDPLDIICSGPTVPDPSSPQECLQIFQHLGIENQVPASILKFLKETIVESDKPEYELPSDSSDLNIKNKQKECWQNVQNVIVGNNKIALTSAKEKSESLGYIPIVLTSRLSGEAKSVGKMFAKLAKYISLSFGCKQSDKVSDELVKLELELFNYNLLKESLKDIITITNTAYATGKAVCLIAGGETTVNVTGQGQGGRNQEMAVSCGMELWELFTKKKVFGYHVAFLSGGTDGQDGPTDVAGGLVTEDFISDCMDEDVDVQYYLDNNDTYNLFKRIKNGSGFVKTGLTGTNVMDIQILIVKQRNIDKGSMSSL